MLPFLWLALATAPPAESGGFPAIELRDPSRNPHGTVGLCIRWAADPRHVADAVVVVSSGDEDLDQGVASAVRRMEWEQPDRYHGEWIGMNMAIGAGAPTGQPLPKCDAVKPPPRPAARGS
jgi:hypothetical protein